MIWNVIIKEVRANISNPKIYITYLVCSILVITSLVSGAVTYLSLKEEISVQARAEKDRLRHIYNYQSDFLQRGMSIYRQPSPLMVLVSGVEGDAAQRGLITDAIYPYFEVSKFNSTPVLAVFGFVDLAFIVKVIMSLFAILFTFDAISGEKELGTLKLNFANEMKRSSFIIGKFIGNFLLLIIPFIIPLVIGLLIIQTFPGIEFTQDDWSRTGLIMLAFLLYLLAFFSMGMMVSSLTGRSTVSFLILLMLWVLFIGVVPRISVLTAQSLRPVPPPEEVAAKLVKEFGPASYDFYSEINEKMKKGQFNIEMMRDEYSEFTKKMQKRGQEYAREQRLKQDYQNQLAITVSRYSSPSAALTFATNRMAKTGVYSYDDGFREFVEGSVDKFNQHNNENLQKNPMLLMWGTPLTKVRDESEVYIEPDEFKPESLQESFGSVIQDYALMSLVSILFLAVAFVVFLRYDVR